MAEMTGKISYYLEVGLFHRIPEIWEKNPVGEVSFKGYKRQRLDKNCATFHCDENNVTVISAAVLDRNKLSSFKLEKRFTKSILSV